SASEPHKIEGLVAKGGSVLKETNHDRYFEAFREHAGEEYSTGQILTILKERYPDFSDGSNRPNDHAGGNKGECPCARTDGRIFDRVKYGLYRVRPSSVLAGQEDRAPT